MPDDIVIEIVAQAIRKVVCDRTGRENKARHWDDIPDTLRASFRDEARAAIKAYEMFKVRC